jgi:hypothetical protein
MDFFVLRSEDGQPPRAALSQIIDARVGDDGELMVGSATALATFSNDTGTWMIGDQPLPEEVANQITERCKELEVEGFGGGEG